MKTLLEGYRAWLEDRTTLKAIEGGEWVEITTPFLDRHNDALRFMRDDAERIAYAMLNDQEPVAGDVIEALKNYEIRRVLWQSRAEVVGELTA